MSSEYSESEEEEEGKRHRWIRMHTRTCKCMRYYKKHGVAMEEYCTHVKPAQKYTKFKCEDCKVVFKHFYDVHFSMEDGMKAEGVPILCTPPSPESVIPE